MWKERLWQVFLVAILGLTLTMCSRSSSNKSTSSTGILNADGTTTVTVSSLPSITLANAGLNVARSDRSLSSNQPTKHYI